MGGPPESEPARLSVGVVRRAVGLRGEVEVVVMSDDPARFSSGSVVYTADAGTPLTIDRVRVHRERTIVSFRGVGDRTSAEALRGNELVVPREEARELGEGEYWDFELVGCTVQTVEGEHIGRVREVLHPPANEILVVGDAGREHLIPFIRDVVRAVDRSEGRIVIDPLPGLLDP